MEKFTTFTTYWLSVLLAWFGTQTPERLAFWVGAACAIFTALVNFWYRRRALKYLKSLGLEAGVIREFIR